MQRWRVVGAVAIFCGAAAMSTQAFAAGPCQLMVISRPAGATVHIDGEERGKTPLMLMDMKIGNHDIKVVLDDHRLWTKRIRFRPGGNTVEAKLEKKGVQAPAPKAGGDDVPAPPEAGHEAPDPDSKAAEEKDKKVEIPKTSKVPCPCCEGTGTITKIGCDTCQADGLVGTDACGACGGSGRKGYSCPFCKSSGSSVGGGKTTECRACRGKGFPLCRACKGTGEVERPNPEAVSYETTTCLSCGGDGVEKQLKCAGCGGKGTVSRMSRDATYVYRVEIDCRLCGGDGSGPPRCRSCGGYGYRGSGKRLLPCMACSGTGQQFLPCRTCRGRGWHRAR